MSFAGIAKIVAGVSVVGGAVATSTILLRNSSANTVVPNTNIGQYYLKHGFVSCKPLLDSQTRNKNNPEIYACPTGKENKLNMVYEETVGRANKIVAKVNELKQHWATNSTQEMKVLLEGHSGEKTLNWPQLLFNYTDPNSVEGKKGNSILKPSEECEFTPTGPKLFKCSNGSWEVIKRR